MKRRIRTASPNGAPASRAVRFEFTAPEASQVFITGSFNDWRTTDLPMIPLGEGKWAKELALVPGRYEYLFVVDDAWVPDPAATETVPNPFWGVNAVVVVPGEAK
jgi:1,4-alpha-glucan branching enzyme